MIIWISGPYGVGKTTLAEAMAAKMDNALVFDVEEVGNAVRGNYPGCPYGYIFEDYPLWGEFCYLLLKDILRARIRACCTRLEYSGGGFLQLRLSLLKSAWGLRDLCCSRPLRQAQDKFRQGARW